jgi:hypothetical protein
MEISKSMEWQSWYIKGMEIGVRGAEVQELFEVC